MAKDMLYSGVVWANVPDALLNQRRWVFWRWRQRGDGAAKKPCSGGGLPINCLQRSNWRSSSYMRRVLPRLDLVGGAGFVFTWDSPICGIDLDCCRDPLTGVIDDWAAAIIERFNSYTEISPSGSGVKLFLSARLRGGGAAKTVRQKGAQLGAKIEVYCGRRFFTVTGQRLDGGAEQVREATAELKSFLAENQMTLTRPGRRAKSAPRAAGRRSSSAGPLADNRVLATARGAKHGAEFERLHDGDWSGYGSQSQADQALVCRLYFWCRHDRAQVFRLFKGSVLYRPDKSTGDGYIQHMIDYAAEHVLPQYQLDHAFRGAIGRKRWDWIPAAGVPTIDLDDPPEEVVRQAVAALAARAPEIFTRGGEAVVVEQQEGEAAWVAAASHGQLQGTMRWAAHFVRAWGDDQGCYERRRLPTDIVRAMRGQALTPLERVAQTPLLRPDGSVVVESGYDAATQIYVVMLPDEAYVIPEAPDQAEARAAANLVTDLIGQVARLDSQTDLTNLLGLLLTLVARPAVDGGVPLALIEEPQDSPTLARLVSYLAFGADSVRVSPTTTRGWQQSISGELTDGAALVAYVACESKLVAPALANALLSSTWQPHASRPALPAQATWLVSGADPMATGALALRHYRVRGAGRLDDDALRDLVLGERSACLTALLTMARAWFVAGRPVAPARAMLSEFTAWRELVGGILHFAGVDGFLAGPEQDDADEAEALCRRVHLQFGDRAFRARDVGDAARLEGDWPLPRSVVGDDGTISDRSLGRWFRRHRDGAFGDERWVVKSAGLDGHNKVQIWRVASATGRADQ